MIFVGTRYYIYYYIRRAKPARLRNTICYIIEHRDGAFISRTGNERKQVVTGKYACTVAQTRAIHLSMNYTFVQLHRSIGIPSHEFVKLCSFNLEMLTN